ncbi:hypothetical protein CR152_23440 [Massilia violaceinigra]|uniref:PAS domain-containing protein n=2 Tax=Massilia violaceinigra TaxID=2045208 RepID=A0A2D2DQA0_9BURK|nr:hypothetical protein CR152_23440 [Massilia violaceinigra]
MLHFPSASRAAPVPRLAAEHLLQLFEQAPSFMAVLLGPHHVFQLANGAYLQLIGHRDPLGKPVREALLEVDGAFASNCNASRTVQSRRATCISYISPSWIHGLLSADESALVLAVPFANDGRLGRFLAIAPLEAAPWEKEDIALVRAMAERVWSSLDTCRAQSALQDERDERRHIFLNMTEGFAIIGSDWQRKQINTLGLKVGQREAQVVVGRSLWDVWPEIIGTEVETRYRRVMASRSAGRFEELVAFSNGENVWLELRLLPMPDGGMAVPLPGHWRP